MGQWWLRVRSVVDSHASVLVIALLVLGLLGGWLTYAAYVDPGTRTVERTVSSWSMTGEYNHSATVTEPNPVVEVGTTQSGRPLYLLSTSPVANGTFTFRYGASDGGQLDVDIVERRVVRSVGTGATVRGAADPLTECRRTRVHGLGAVLHRRSGGEEPD